MKLRNFYLLLTLLFFIPDTHSRKIKIPAVKAQPVASTAKNTTFVVNKNNPHDSIKLSDIVFTRFDKPVESRYETFLCKNTTTSSLVEIIVNIDYSLTDGTKIHSRKVTIPCDIPPGETRQLSIKSFDKQQSYRYIGSRVPPRREATPFKVALTPVSLTFKAER